MSAGEFSPATVALIWDRDRGLCAWGGGVIRGDRGADWSVHHREPRGMGGSRRRHVAGAANGLLLHGHGVSRCHGRVEVDRELAIAAGFLVSRLGVQRPCEVPVRHAVHGWVLLADVGGVQPVPRPGVSS